jgi:hypothetical protein
LEKLTAAIGVEERETGSAESGFVALDGVRLDAGRERCAVLELVAGDSERLRVEVVGDASGVDLVGLARAFWSRGA